MVDWSVISAPSILGHYYESVFCTEDLALVGDHVFATNKAGRIQAVDVSSPGKPKFAGVIGSYPIPQDMVMVGTTAYVASGVLGLRIFDMNVPAQPTEIGHTEDVGDARVVAVFGSHAFVGTNEGVVVVDISDAANPAIVERYTYGNAGAIAIQDQYAYIGVWNSESDGSGHSLRVVDISNPTQWVEVGQADSKSFVRNITVADDVVYMAVQTYGLLIFDISNRATPQLVMEYKPQGDTTDVFIRGFLAYVTGSILTVLDVSTPTAPVSLAEHQAPFSMPHVHIEGKYAYAANGQGGLLVLYLPPHLR